MKDAAWAPAVESYLSSRFLGSFCVDNNQDAKFLNSIMKEIYYNETFPQIISSKFFNKVRICNIFDGNVYENIKN